MWTLSRNNKTKRGDELSQEQTHTLAINGGRVGHLAGSVRKTGWNSFSEWLFNILTRNEWEFKIFFLFVSTCFGFVAVVLIYFVYGWLACMYVCVHYMCLEPTEGRRRHWIPWDYRWLGATMYQGTGNWTQALWKNIHCSWPLSHLSSPVFFYEKL